MFFCSVSLLETLFLCNCCCWSSRCVAEFKISICSNLRVGRDEGARLCSQSHFIIHDLCVLPNVRVILFILPFFSQVLNVFIFVAC